MKKIKGFKTLREDMSSYDSRKEWKLNKWQVCTNGVNVFQFIIDTDDVIDLVRKGDETDKRLFLIEATGIVNEYDDGSADATDLRIIKELPIEKIEKEFCELNDVPYEKPKIMGEMIERVFIVHQSKAQVTAREKFYDNPEDDYCLEYD